MKGRPPLLPGLLAGLLLGLLPGLASALPQLDLELDLDPVSRRLAAVARLTDDRDLPGFFLAPGARIERLAVDGRPLVPAAAERQGRRWYRLPPGSRRVEIAYQATLAAPEALDHRQVLQGQPAVAGPEGSFLPAGTGWYPQVPALFAYRLALRLPPGQKGVAPGELVAEADDGAGYRAEYRYPQPAEGIDLMAGPYTVAERPLTLPGGRAIRIRSWFHPELAGLAPGYLEDSARYIERYSRLIGDYPFPLFSIVSSPTPTGFGMPGLTYLGREVLRLPFIRATSLGHEVLHNWWGNGVYPDWQRGNWSEGLTTFLADYAYKEEEGEAAAREMRLGWLRNLAAIPAGEDTALRDFTSRRHGISSIVGYDKAAMVFLMLRDEIGRPAFERGLRLFWQRQRFRVAGWAELEAAFAEAAGRPLTDFFRQWLDRTGAPVLDLQGARQQSGRLELEFARAPGYRLAVPLRLTGPGGSEERVLALDGRGTRASLPAAGPVASVELDPDYRLWRRVDPALLPPILREVFVAPRVSLAVAADGEPAREAARALAARLLDASPVPVDAAPDSGALLVVGTTAQVEAWLARQGLPPRPEAVAAGGSARVWAGRDGQGKPHAVVAAADAAALQALARGLPHYGRQSWLVFEGGRAAAKGLWPPRAAPVAVASDAAR